MRRSFGLAGVFVVVWMVLCCVAGVALALPAGREYEMVSPLFKGGFGALHIEAVASDGESVVFYSPGVFDGAPSGPDLMDYLARRGAAEWSTVPLIAPAPLIAYLEFTDVSPPLDMVLAAGGPGPEFENRLPREDLLLHSTSLPDTEAGWESLGKLESPHKKELFIQERAADVNFCHVLFGATGSTEALLPEAKGVPGALYEFDRGCDGKPALLTLVGVNNKSKLINSGCGVDVGAEDYAFNGINTFNAVSADGSAIFFTVCLSGPGSRFSPHQLFVRLDGSRTVEVSKPFSRPEGCREVPCEKALERGSAEFAGASQDGSRVFFTAPLAGGQPPLVPGDTDASNNLYLATIGCPESKPECEAAEREVTSLAQASHDPNGGAADVRGVVRVAPDGQRAYFVAGGDLLSSAQRQVLEGEGRPVPWAGADNLYVYDGSASPGGIAFVGELCSGRELSGAVEDIRCPSAGADALLWSSDRGAAQTGGRGGGFLVFATYAQLSGDDANTAKDVYRYNAETGVLERVSTGEGGYDANGNGGSLGATIAAGHRGQGEEGGSVRSQYEMDNRAVSEDGSRIVFTSAEPLSPAASNGLTNAYEWHEAPGGSGGSVSLVSSGSGEEPVDDVAISPDGANVFFDTVEGLVPQDIDGAPDVYDARLEGAGEGSPQPAVERRPCEGDACQGPLTNPAPLLVPGSVSQAPGGNFAKPVSKKKKAKTKRAKRKKSRGKKGRSGRKGKASVRSGSPGVAIGRGGR